MSVVELTKCPGCKETITAEEVLKKQVVSLLDRLWHQDHIDCMFCKLPITDGRIFESHENENDLVCYACHIENANPACTGCGLSTFERAFVAEERIYHVDCMRCTGCYRTIAFDDGFYFRDMILYDDTCFILNKDNE